MRCAIYTRVSTDEQARPEYSSLETQADICRNYVEVQRGHGWEVVGIYEDGGCSGGDLNRPAIRRLMGDVRRGRVDVVITYKLDRISRSLRDFYEFWGVLQQHDVTFVSATQSFDTSAPAGNLMLNILLSFAQFERETTAERTAAKMRARAQRGLWNGGVVPYGYTYDSSRQLLLPDPHEAAIVERIFDEFVGGESIGRICEGLNRDGLKTRARLIGRASGNPRTVGGTPFRPDSIKAVLGNPIYTGMIRCQGEMFPGRHQALIPSDIFEQAGLLLARRGSCSPRPDRDRYIHLLKGLIRCDDCGSTMTPYPSGKIDRSGEQYLYYVCTAVIRDQRGSGCQVRRLPVRRFERAVIGLLASLAESPDLLGGQLKRSQIADGRQLGALTSRRDELLASQDDIERRLDRLMAHFGEDDVPVFVAEQMRRLDVRREQARHQIAGVEARLGQLREATVGVDELAQRLAELGDGCRGLDEQKMLVQGLVGKIEVDRWRDSTPDDRPDKARPRTRRLVVNISLAPSHRSDRRRGRICAVIPCWGDVDSSRVAAEFVLHHGVPPETPFGDAAVPDIRPKETPEQRALRFQQMLDAGEVKSRAELARRLGVTPSAITKALRRLPPDRSSTA